MSDVKTPRSILHLAVLSQFVSFERPTSSSGRGRVSLRFDDGAIACDELADAIRCEAAEGASEGVDAVPAAGAD